MAKPLGIEKHIDEIKNIDTRRHIRDYAEANREIQSQINALEAAKKVNNKELGALMKKNRLSKVDGDGWQVLRVMSDRSSIKKERLLSKGVSLEIINECTEVTTTESVRVIGAKEEASAALGGNGERFDHSRMAV